MQQAHNRVFMLKGTGLHNRAPDHFNQAASDGINHNTDHNAGKRIGKQVRNKSQAGQAGGGKDLGSHHAAPVSDGIHKACAEYIHQQLGQKKRGGNQGNSPQRNHIIRVKFQEQQRGKIGADRLGDKSQITGQQRLPVILCHGSLRVIMFA